MSTCLQRTSHKGLMANLYTLTKKTGTYCVVMETNGLYRALIENKINAIVKNGIVQRVNGLVILPFYETQLSNVVQ